jgi:hypothetical protein
VRQLTGPGGVVESSDEESVRPGDEPRRVHGAALKSLADSQFASPVLAGLAAAAWLIGLHPVPPSSMGSLGLVPELSWLVIVAYPLLLVAVVLELLRHKPRAAVLGVLTVLGVFGVYGLQPAVEEVAREPVAWLHTGFANYIGQYGDIKHEYDARFAWPGFFSLVAFVVRASGQTDAAPLMNWAPVVLSGMATLGVRAFAVAVLGDGRAAWLAAWVFLVANWTEQDYFSPQGTTFVLMLAVLALTAQHLVRPGLLAPGRASLRSRLVPANTSSDRIWAQLLVLAIMAALAPSHQLTPFVLGGLLGVMLLWGRLWPGWLPVLALVPPTIWFALNAKEFWYGHLGLITGGLGNVQSSLNEGIQSRFVGDSGRELILLSRMGITGFVGLLALAGFVVLWRRGTRTLVLPALALAPFGLAVLQPYGGEVFIRCYLFALPFFAVAAGVALGAAVDRVVVDRVAAPQRSTSAASGADTERHDGEVRGPKRGMRLGSLLSRRALLAGSACSVLVVLCLATVTARGGNDAYISLTKADVSAMHEAYRLASPGQQVDVLAPYGTLASARLDEVVQGTIEDDCSRFTDIVNCIMTARPDFLVLSPSQEAYGRIYYGLRQNWTDRLVGYLVSSGSYRVVFDQNRSRVLAKTTGTEAQG